jgi:hypothetical protein
MITIMDDTLAFIYARARKQVHINHEKFTNVAMSTLVKRTENTINEILAFWKSSSLLQTRLKSLLDMYRRKDIGLYLFIPQLLSMIKERLGDGESLVTGWDNIL